ncbi:hypothetical protein M422DRAFT_240961 [Sphaerobolus stellatus SS14]|nr:hypothetical protein M422DRAFT_240961 [Sphaerobolus stellatus SS14]
MSSSTATYAVVATSPPPMPMSFNLPFVLPVAPSRRRDDRPQPAANDLRGYLATATLASIRRNNRAHPYVLPPRGARSNKNEIRVRHDTERKIKSIRRHDKAAFDSAMLEYHKKHVYDDTRGRPYVGKSFRTRPPTEALTLPAESYIPEVPLATIPYPCSVSDTCEWLKQGPFQTIQRAMHLAFPDTHRWWFDPDAIQDENEENRDIWCSYAWRFHPNKWQDAWWLDTKGRDGQDRIEKMAHDESLVVVVQPPYILSWQDLINVSKVNALNPTAYPPTAHRKRVWSHLLDTCQKNHSRHFILTTYEGWLFGKFSNDWLSVNVSETMEYNSKDPNVMQAAVYWVASSMGLAGTSRMIPVRVSREDGGEQGGVPPEPQPEQEQEEQAREEQPLSPRPIRPLPARALSPRQAESPRPQHRALSLQPEDTPLSPRARVQRPTSPS